MMEQPELNRERVAEDYRNSIIASVKHDESPVPEAAALREQHKEYGTQLDENEDRLKEQYDECGCAEQTGLDADGYRHEVISDYTHEQLSEQRQGAEAAEAYWAESQSSANAGISQEAGALYWNLQDVAERGCENDLEIEEMCANQSGQADVRCAATNACGDNSVANAKAL